MIEEKGLGSSRKLLVEHYSEFMEILKREGDNVVSVGVEMRDLVEYFRIILKK